MRQKGLAGGASRYAEIMFESEEPQEQEQEQGGGTSPEEPTHEATTPPGNGPPDEGALEEAQDQLDQAGGGH
jgi:hypothetical protein